MQDRKIVDYGVIDGNQPAEISRKIEELIKEGWQPYGHPFHIHSSEYFYIFQAMVKYEESEKWNLYMYAYVYASFYQAAARLIEELRIILDIQRYVLMAFSTFNLRLERVLLMTIMGRLRCAANELAWSVYHGNDAYLFFYIFVFMFYYLEVLIVKYICLLSVLFILCGCSQTGTGERVGQVVKISSKGFIHNTTEVEIIKGSLNSGSGSFGSKFDFTISNPELIPVAHQAFDNGKEIIVRYHSTSICPLSSDSPDCDFADSITVK